MKNFILLAIIFAIFNLINVVRASDSALTLYNSNIQKVVMK